MKNISVSLQKQRNYSFLTKSSDTLDSVEDGDDEFIIPAQNGSCYWAIIKIGYIYHDKPLSLNEYIDQVANLLEERDPIKWEKFKNKKKIKTLKNGQVVEKNANHWRKRIETNIKTLTRDGGSNPYGKRLIELGHILRWEPMQIKGQGAFVLRTTTNEPLELKKGRKSKLTKKTKVNVNTKR